MFGSLVKANAKHGDRLLGVKISYIWNYGNKQNKGEMKVFLFYLFLSITILSGFFMFYYIHKCEDEKIIIFVFLFLLFSFGTVIKAAENGLL